MGGATTDAAGLVGKNEQFALADADGRTQKAGPQRGRTHQASLELIGGKGGGREQARCRSERQTEKSDRNSGLGDVHQRCHKPQEAISRLRAHSTHSGDAKEAGLRSLGAKTTARALGADSKDPKLPECVG